MKIKTANRLAKKAEIYYQIVKKHVFDDCFYRGLGPTVSRIKKYRGVIKKLLNIHQIHDDIFYRRHPAIVKSRKQRGKAKLDLRTGAETYGYESLESIGDNLRYISDRFNADFRLRWMLNVPEEVEKLTK